MIKFLATVAAAIVCISSMYISVSAQQIDLTNADSCILIDGKTGIVLFEKNSDRKQYPASTTKILTAALALEKGSLDQVMTASQAAVNDIGKDGMNIGIMAGEQIKLENLLEAMLIRSANETANIIAENISPTRQEFIDLMNEKAQELGALNTYFTNPCGSHDENHYTTAADLAKIARYAVSFPKIREIAVKKSFQMPPTNKHNEWPVLASTNNLLKSPENDLYTVTGLKTGYTVPAGHCLVSTAINPAGMELISVVLGVRNDNAKNNIVKYSKNLLTYGYENFEEKQIDYSGRLVRTINVEDSDSDSGLDIITADDFSFIMPKGDTQWNLNSKVVLNPEIKAPVEKGDLLGYIEYSKDGVPVGKVKLVASSDIAQKSEDNFVKTVKSSSVLSLLLKVIIYTTVFLIAFFILRISLRTISRRKKSQKVH